ncbi:AAA family ATPase [Aquimarina celericrescens]|uniref:Thymidylate kinase n=1 Tax=Aquimarina celericrescens TaxID=1964542 RepID=A0ABW5AY11_9FLAO|nr:hypothetical protein [Aquimarina celericrescens]
MSIIIALDGHDGVGKTTLAKQLVEQHNGIYVRPFGGKSGIDLIEAADNQYFDKVSAIGKQAINEAMLAYIDHTRPLIFDRHWITVLSLLPEHNRICWPHPIYSFLCSAELTTIKSRLSKRTSEKQFEDAYHSHYLNTYLKIAKVCGSTVIETDHISITGALQKINEILNTYL